MEVQYTISSLLQSEVLYLKALCDIYGFFKIRMDGVLSLVCFASPRWQQNK